MVIENVKLTELVAKGPKYQEPNKINWTLTKTMVLDSIDLYARNSGPNENRYISNIFLNGKTKSKNLLWNV